MADSKVSALAAAGAYNDADILYIIQGGVSVKTTWGSIKTALQAIIEYPEVANYAALPAAASHSGEIYVCLASQGSVWLLTLKDSGFYRSDGATWTRLGALPADYFTDSVLSIADDADPTKVVKFDCSTVATLTTRTFTWPNASGTVMLVGQAPTAHKTSHENGGGDEISVAGLSGQLADPQPPIIGASATQAVAGNDARLTDERVPTAAGLTSKFGTNKASIVDGDKIAILNSAASDVPVHILWSLVKSTLKTYFDTLYTTAAAALAAATAIKLDDFGTPDDNTDLNASTSAHGLLKKLSNVSTEYLNGQGNWATPAGGGGGTYDPLDMTKAWVVEDFFSSAAGEMGWQARTISTGSTNTWSSALDYPGYVETRTGTTSGSGGTNALSSNSGTNQFKLSNSVFDCKFIIVLTTSITGCRFRVGLVSDPTAIEAANGVWVRYDPAVNSDTKFQGICRASSSDTPCSDMGVTPALDTRYTIRIRGDGTYIYFSINGGTEQTVAVASCPTALLTPCIVLSGTGTDCRVRTDRVAGYFTISR